jgi:hypothetical protein
MNIRASTAAVLVITGVGVLLGTSPASASHLPFLNVPFYSQDFDALSNGTINGQDGWFGGAGDVVQSTVVVSGKALQVSDSGAGRHSGSVPLTFSTTHNYQKVAFDIRLATTINDFAGVPNTDIQETIQFRGPVANQQFFLVYKGTTNGAGTVVANRWEFRTNPTGPGTTVSANTVQKDIFYHVEMELNLNGKEFDGVITNAATSFTFDPAIQPGWHNDGNINYAAFFADNSPVVATMYVDNFAVLVPEPMAGFSVLGAGAMLLARRRTTTR